MDKQLYPIEPAEFVIDSKESVEGGLQYKLSFAMSDQKCPFCDSSDIVKNGTRNKYHFLLQQYEMHLPNMYLNLKKIMIYMLLMFWEWMKIRSVAVIDVSLQI